MTPPRKDPTRPVKTHPSEADGNTATSSVTPTSIVVDRAITQKIGEWPKYVAVLITIIGMIVGATVWASSSHDQLKSFTLERDYATEIEIKNSVKEQYVPKHEFSAMEQNLADQKATLEKIENKLDRILEQPCKQR